MPLEFTLSTMQFRFVSWFCFDAGFHIYLRWACSWTSSLAPTTAYGAFVRGANVPWGTIRNDIVLTCYHHIRRHKRRLSCTERIELDSLRWYGHRTIFGEIWVVIKMPVHINVSNWSITQNCADRLVSSTVYCVFFAVVSCMVLCALCDTHSSR